MKHSGWLGLLFLVGTSAALNVTVNGQPSPASAIVQGGTTFVSVDALKALGITVTVTNGVVNLAGGPTGGANQAGAVEGCVNQQLFNGAFRLKVLGAAAGDVKDYSGNVQPGYLVTLEIRNGMNAARTVNDLGFGGYGGGPQFFLAYPDDSTLKPTRHSLDLFRPMPPGGAMQVQVEYIPDAAHAGQTPSKFLMLKTNDIPGFRWSVPDPSFRVRLDCPK